jgi:hypothetical protein
MAFRSLGNLELEKEGSASFFEKKEAKKLSFTAGLGALMPAPAGAKVFCFFFSKKKRFLSYC